jgi:acetyl esterase/lipase
MMRLMPATRRPVAIRLRNPTMAGGSPCGRAASMAWRLATFGVTMFLICLPLAMAFGRPAATTLRYGHDPQETADLYRAVGQSNPAVVVIHGGGFVGGDKAGLSLVWTCWNLVRHGITCFSIDYRLLRRYDPSTLGWAQFVEVQLAMRWVRANAVRFGIDPGKVCAWGVSAGAYYAALLGVTAATYRGNAVNDPFGESRILPRYPSRADCVVAIGVPANLATLTNRVAVRVFANLLSATALYRRDPEAALTAASPLAHVSPGSAPIYIIQGAMDPFFPAATQARALADALRAKGVLARYVTYPGGHAFCRDDAVPCRKLMRASRIIPYLDAAAAWVATTVERSDVPRRAP